MQRLDANDLLKRLIRVAESNNISVLFRRNKSQCIHLENDDSIVIVNKDNKPLTQALVLSHELGHALSIDKEQELEGMQEGVQLLEGEVHAWSVAESLLREICRKSMPLKEFLMIKHACLTSYYKKAEVNERGEVI
jgi:Zn-dependent peptidase ImmA (M78 family)